MIKSKQLVIEYRTQIGKYSYKEMDCIKSIANIMNRYGGKADVIGSNWYARNEIRNLRPLTDKSQLYDGCAVLKTKLPGEPGYALPDKYADHVVQIDYSHIGLGTDGGEILDSTTVRSGDKYLRNGPGVSTAKIGSNSWDVMGDFEDSDYSDRGINVGIREGKVEVKMEKTAMVVASTGNNVNLRSRPSVKSVVLEYVLIGTKVGVGEENGDWVKVYSPTGKQGWMQKSFLYSESTSTGSAPVPVTETKNSVTLSPVLVAKLKQARILIDEVLENA